MIKAVRVKLKAKIVPDCQVRTQVSGQRTCWETHKTHEFEDVEEEFFDPARPKDMRAHLRALQKMRARLSKLWKECGKAKQNAQQDHSHLEMEWHWARMVKHKKLQRFFHLSSQLLKEVKQIKRHLD